MLTLAIVSPIDGETFLQGTEIAVEIAAAKHPDGFAIASVSLAIDGEIVAVDDNDPWQFFGPPFPGPGIYTLVAIAQDWAGNQVESEPIVIGWGDTEFPDPDDDSGAETGEGEPATPSGSSCTIADDAPARGWTIAAFALLLVIRPMKSRYRTTRRASATKMGF